MNVNTVFEHQTQNVKFLKQVQNILWKNIKESIKNNDNISVKYKTLQYSHLYSALSEAEFIQILSTPNAFEVKDVTSIKKLQSIEDKWDKMIDIAFDKFGSNWKSDPDLYNKYNIIKTLINNYIIKPKKLRNKIAHGQWVIALDGKNSKIDPNITNELKNLDSVKITIWFEVHKFLCSIVRDLVQSPKNAFKTNFQEHYNKLQKHINAKATWTENSLKKFLQTRKRKTDNQPASTH